MMCVPSVPRGSAAACLGLRSTPAVGLILLTGQALGQPAPPEETPISEIVIGELMMLPTATISPAGGDVITATFGGEVVGLFEIPEPAPSPILFDIQVFGDDPETAEVEGPAPGDRVSFSFFDSSTATSTNAIAPANDAGEIVNYLYNGDVAFDFPIVLPGFPPLIAPSRELDLVLGVETDTPTTPPGPPAPGGGPAGGGDGGADGIGADLNGDGRIDKFDAALVLRAVVSGPSAPNLPLASLDIDGNGVVEPADAASILRQQD